MVFVGPSGCGKTTLLRLIAGLEDVTGGQILIDGKNVVDVPPAKRGLSMVFQSYALYPHMSVRGNIALRPEDGGPAAPGDRPQGGGRRRHAQSHALSRPKAARAFRRPAPARRDRPRHRARAEGVPVRRAVVESRRRAPRPDAAWKSTKLQKQLGTTAIYVTHDQVEAMTMADKIVVLNAGQIEQYGSPLELYEHPANLFVAGFIGSPKMNFVSGEAAGEHGAATIGVRPEHLKIGKEGEGWPGTVSVAEHLGSDTFLYVDAGKLGTADGALHRRIQSEGRRPGLAVARSGPPAPLRQGWRGHQDMSGVARRDRGRQTGEQEDVSGEIQTGPKDRRRDRRRPGHWACLRRSAGGSRSEGRDRRSRSQAGRRPAVPS